MLRKQYFLLFCFILLAGMFSFARAEAANREPLKIARMPLLVASAFSPHADAVDSLEQRLDQALHPNAGRILRPLRSGRNARFTSLS